MTMQSVIDGPLSYGRWAVDWGEPIEVFGEAEARRRHAVMEEYAVLFGEPDAWRAVLRVTARRSWFRVAWLDGAGREVLTHLFVPGTKYGRDDSWRFLEQVTIFAYQTEAPPRPFPFRDERLILKTYFDPDGSAYVRRHEMGEHYDAELPPSPELVGDGGPSILWEPTPEFGDWASIMRRDRDAQ